MISTKLFCCYEKVFPHMNTSMIRKNSVSKRKTSLPEKEDFYSHLNMKDITDADYRHGKKSLRGF